MGWCNVAIKTPTPSSQKMGGTPVNSVPNTNSDSRGTSNRQEGVGLIDQGPTPVLKEVYTRPNRRGTVEIYE